ncbi:hypothetical protein AC1031_004184 [Aphanomyces cochlioides]|nr:hypothetical protein AC1031_004184 [Aphanomyces cochlioides]
MTSTPCTDLCLSSVTSAACNRSESACPTCVFPRLGIYVCSYNCTEIGATVCPAQLNASTIFVEPTITTMAPTEHPTTKLPSTTENSSSGALIPSRLLLILLLVSGSVCVLLACCAWMYRRKVIRDRENNNLTIVRHDPTKSYNPTLAHAKLDLWNDRVSSFLRKSTTQTQSTSGWLSDLFIAPSPQGLALPKQVEEPDPWLFTNPYRRSSVVDLLQPHPEEEAVDVATPLRTVHLNR